MERYKRKIEKMIAFCRSLSNLSTCRRHPTAAIVFPFDCTAVYAIGYNGPPVGIANNSCSGQLGDCGCIHAEANTLLKLTESSAVMFCMMSPCMQCAGLIINSQRIDYVIYDMKYRDLRGIQRLNSANILVNQMKDVNYDYLYERRTACRISR